MIGMVSPQALSMSIVARVFSGCGFSQRRTWKPLLSELAQPVWKRRAARARRRRRVSTHQSPKSTPPTIGAVSEVPSA